MPRMRVAAIITIFLSCIASALPAHADDGQDRVSFGHRIFVNENESAGDLVCFFCSVESHGKVDGDVVSFFGGVKTEGPIRGDVVSFFGDVSVTHDGSIGGDTVVLGGNLHKSADAHLGQSQVVFPLIVMLLPFLLFAAIIWGIVHLIRRSPPVYFPTVGR